MSIYVNHQNVNNWVSVTLIIKVETLMIKVTCLPNYYLFGDLHTADIIPSTFLLWRHVTPSSWKRTGDLMFPKQ